MNSNFYREDVAVKEDPANVLEHLHNTLQLDKKRIDDRKIKTSIHCVVANLVYHESSILIEHFSNRYQVSPYRSFKTERKVIILLHDLGYVDIYRGLSNAEFKKLRDSGLDMSEHLENGKHRRSSMWLTNKGKEYFAGVKAEVMLVVRRRKNKDFENKKSKKKYDYFPFLGDA